MATEIATAYVSLVPSFRGGSRAISGALARPISQAGPQAGRSLGRSILGGVAKAAAVGGGLVGALGIAGLGRAALSAASGLQDTQATLSGMLGSADDARDTISRLRDVARTSPISASAYLEAGEALAYMGIQGGEAEGILRNVGAAVTAAGGDDESIGRATTAMLQMVNSGKVYAAQLNQISDAGIPIFSGLAAHFDTNIANVREMVSAGQVGIEDVMATIENAEGDTFQAMITASENASQTLSNQWKIAKDNIVTALGDELLPIVESLTPLMQRFATAAPGAIAGAADAIRGFISGIQGQVATVRAGIQDFMSSATGQQIKTDTMDRLRSIWARLTTSFEQAWPAVQSIAASLGQASAAVGISTWQILLATLDLLSGVIQDVLVPALQWLADFMRDHPALVTTIVGAYTAWRVAQLALNVAMRANPIGLIITLLGALVAGLVYAWKNSQTFRDIVTSAWNAIRAAARVVWAFIRDQVIAPFVAGARNIWSVMVAVKDGIVAAWNAIRDGLGAAWNWVNTNVIQRAIGGFQAVGRTAVAIKDGVVAAWRAVRDGLGAGWAWIRDNVFGPTRRGFQNVWEKAVAVKDGIVKAWETVADTIKTAFDNILGGIKSALKTVFKWINSNMISPVNNMLDPFGVPDIPKIPTKFHTGGSVPGNGELPAVLLGGEYVLDRESVKRAGGKKALDGFRSGKVGDNYLGAMGGWGLPDWASWDTIKQGLALGADAATGKLALREGLLAAVKGLAQTVKSGVGAVIPGPDFVEGPVEGSVNNAMDALVEWAKSGREQLAPIGKGVGGFPSFKGKFAFPLPRGSYSVGGGIGSYPGHTGRDFPAPIGTPVFSPMSGRVDFVSMLGSYGKHANVYAGALRFIAAHLSSFVGGDRNVKAGEMIGRVGSTGNSTGPHLHAEFRRNGGVINPDSIIGLDSGIGVLAPGHNLVYNGTGGPEPVVDPRRFDTKPVMQVNTYGTPKQLVSDVMFAIRANQQATQMVGV